MADVHVETASDEGTEALSVVGDSEVELAAGGEDTPSPVEVLVTSYASCFLGALRFGARRNGVRDLGRVEIEADAAVDTDGLESVSFLVSVEADLDDPDEIVETAWRYCHVNAALDPSLRADVTVEDDAF